MNTMMNTRRRTTILTIAAASAILGAMVAAPTQAATNTASTTSIAPQTKTLKNARVAATAVRTSGNITVTVTSNAKKVRVMYKLKKKKTKAAKIRHGNATVILPRKVKSVKVAAVRSKSIRSSSWKNVRITTAPKNTRPNTNQGNASNGTDNNSGNPTNNGGNGSSGGITGPKPDTTPRAEFVQTVLADLNNARTAGARCGGVNYPSMPAITLDPTLVTTAQQHSNEMLSMNYFSAYSPHGVAPWDRAWVFGFDRNTSASANVFTFASSTDMEYHLVSLQNQTGEGVNQTCRILFNEDATIGGVGMAGDPTQFGRLVTIYQSVLPAT